MVESSAYDLDLIFHALSDPTRRAILKTLTRHERPITSLAKPFEISLAAVSKHVQVLERARLVHRTRRGSYSYLSLNGKAMGTAYFVLSVGVLGLLIWQALGLDANLVPYLLFAISMLAGLCYAASHIMFYRVS
jgi:DNA-binding transcriptional ArsR family regulator